MRSPHGRADYLLFLDGAAAGVIEAKKEGETLTGVEWQSAKYVDGLRTGSSRRSRALPFTYESTGVETRFTNCARPGADEFAEVARSLSSGGADPAGE